MSAKNNMNNNSQHPFSAEERDQVIVIFIIGPYARKWFSQPASEPVEHAPVRWILAPEAEDLHKQWKRLRLPDSRTVIRAFFPFLPDGHGSSELIHAQLNDWQSQFLAHPLTEPLPCVFGLYTQLSHQRSVDDPEQAIWLGNFDLTVSKETTFNHELSTLNTMLMQISHSGGYHAVQRLAMADALQLWMHETGIIKSLQTLFSRTSLMLTAVLFSDYGAGFVRHGAWANWIADRFQIYPGLASTMSLPQLPDALHMPAIKTWVYESQKPRRRVTWIPATITLLLALLMVGITWHEGERLTQMRNNLLAFNQLDIVHFQQKHSALSQLIKYRDELSGCSFSRLLQILKLSNCNKVLAELNKAIKNTRAEPLLFSSESVALFSSDSSQLKEGSDEILRTLLPVINNNPQTTFMIIGHSDNSGTHQRNMQISKERAIVVRDWLIKHTNIPVTRFVIKGVGESAPIASNDTDEGRKRNRRVDIIPLPENYHINNE